MSELIERVARALVDKIEPGENPNARSGSLLNEGELIWHQYIPAARAAIEAMRELPEGGRIEPEVTTFPPCYGD